MKQQIIHHISVFLVVIVALTSIIQFHHHDCDGNIYIHLTTLEDLSLGHSHNGIEECKHHHNQHDNGHNDCDGENNCSMHLGVYTVTRQNNFDYIASLPLIDAIPAETLQVHGCETIAISENTGDNDKPLQYDDLILSSSAFRAPPYILI